MIKLHFLKVIVIPMSNDPNQQDLRHYLEIRSDADVASALRVYCKRAHFHSYVAADRARARKLEEYNIKDSSIIEVKFRR